MTPSNADEDASTTPPCEITRPDSFGHSGRRTLANTVDVFVGRRSRSCCSSVCFQKGTGGRNPFIYRIPLRCSRHSASHCASSAALERFAPMEAEHASDSCRGSITALPLGNNHFWFAFASASLFSEPGKSPAKLNQ